MLGEESLERADFDGVSERCAGRVALDVTHLAGVHARRAVGFLVRPQLAIRVGRQEVPAGSVVREADALDDRIDRVAIAHRVRVSLDDDEAAALPR